MKAYLTNLWDWLRTSLWFVPTIVCACAVAASFLMPMVDETFDTARLPGIGTTPTAARATLSAIAGAMMTVTGTVFSITVVTLSLTSQQFGPRLLRTFVHDLPTQFAMGIFVSTGLYCLLVLRIVEQQEELRTVPHLSVSVAVLFTVISMGTLIYFIHHIAILIQAPHVVEAVALDLEDAIQRLFPEHIGDSLDEETQQARDAIRQAEQLDDNFTIIPARGQGYIQAVDIHGLMVLARDADLVIQLCGRPGHFASRDTPLARVWNEGDRSLDNLAKLVNDRFILGTRRTPRQDVECSIEELVEVAVRSLSPGINDPFTAINCIDWLKACMSQLAQRKIPNSHHCDPAGQLRLIVPSVTFANVMDAAFTQIRQYGCGSAAVIIRLLEAFQMLAGCVASDEDRESVRKHADIVLRTAERSISEGSDLRDVRQRHLDVIQELERRGSSCSKPVEGA